MVTMSLVRKEKTKKTGLLSRLKASITPERKQKAYAVAKQMGRGAGVMGRGLYKGLAHVGENIERSGMFTGAEQPKRSEYLPGARKGKGRKTTKRARKPKSRLQELQEAGMI